MLFPRTFPVIHRLSVAKLMCVLAAETDCSPLSWYPCGRRERVDRDLGGEGTIGVLSSGGGRQTSPGGLEGSVLCRSSLQITY